MGATNDFSTVFTALVQVMRPFGEKLVCIRDDDAEYYVNTSHIMKNKKPLFFGAVQIRKNYVSYHLMPVYVFPDLLKGLSPELRKRMQGKSCFNFTSLDPALFSELSKLTAAGFERYNVAGFV
jgi:hypothetical protein